MNRTLLFAIAGVLLGGIIHIAAVLKVPAYAPTDIWNRISEALPANQFNRLSSVGEADALIPMLDPMMTHALCRYSLDNGAIRMRAKLPATFWSVALYNRSGENVFSINDRSAGAEDLDMLVLTADQLAIIRENPPEELEDLLVIEALDRQGFAILHVFSGDSTLQPQIDKGVKEATCEIRPF